jgi:hypothetical protein
VPAPSAFDPDVGARGPYVAPDAFEIAHGPVDEAMRRVADLAVAAGRELSTEQLVDHARALGPDPQLSGLEDDELERRFVSSTCALNAATAAWFVLLAEVVVRGLWADQGARTPAQWLSWRVGLAPSTAREQLRVAVRLRELPEVMARFAAGTLSYSKVRAITRIAVPELQQLLLAWADHATGADLERIARGVTRARRAGSVDPELRPPFGAELRFDDDAAIVQLRFPTEEGLEVFAALERLAEVEQTLAEAALEPGDSLPQVSRPQRIAEVAMAVIVAAREQAPPDTSGLDRHTLVVELTGEDLARVEGQVPVGVPAGRVPAMSARVLRRLACVTIASSGAGRSTSAVVSGSRPPSNDEHFVRGTGPAASRGAAPPATCTLITCSTGPTAAPPTWTTSSCCAPSTTGSSTSLAPRKHRRSGGRGPAATANSPSHVLERPSTRSQVRGGADRRVRPVCPALRRRRRCTSVASALRTHLFAPSAAESEEPRS